MVTFWLGSDTKQNKIPRGQTGERSMTYTLKMQLTNILEGKAFFCMYNNSTLV